MQNVFTVAGFEIRSLLTKPSFWLLTVFFPLFILGLTFGGQLMAGDNGFGPTADDPQDESPVTAYVDESGLITSIPADIPIEMLQAYPSQDAAMTALNAREIDEYYVIAADYVDSGRITLIQRDYQPMGRTSEDMLQSILNFNLLGADAARWLLVSNPLGDVQVEQIAPSAPAEGAAANDADRMMATLVPIAAVMLLFFVLVMSSGYMLRSVSREKENRTVEVLLLSLRPRDLMLGKILGLCVVALLQMGLWLTAGMVFMDRGSEFLAVAGSLQLPPSFVVWTMIYVLLGYLLYASLMGALGALAPTSREANQFSFAVLLPLIIPVWMNSFIAQAPNGTLAVALSLFPLTSPPSMIARLASTDVPFWQPAVGVVGLAITTYLAILLSARFFRADTLLSNAAMSWGNLFRAVRG
ncbi:MAG: ABC transporter permease [Caldilineaceae bacterium]|nr:ABC transporter permease [Caldilineaceae bacterium]